MSQEKKERYHHGNLRQALIEGALELIEEAEPFQFTLREAARRAGVAASAPYRHFESKAALLEAIAQEGSEKMFAMMTEAMSREEHPQERFRAMGLAFVQFAVEHPSYFRVLHMPEHIRPELSSPLRAATEQSATALSQVFGQMNKEQVIAPDVALFQWLAAQALTYGLARMFVDGIMERFGVGKEYTVQVAKAITDVLGHGLMPREESTQHTPTSSLTEEERSQLLAQFAPMFRDLLPPL